MPLFWKPYKSDTTQFIEQLRAQRPTLEAEQRAGRGLLWDASPLLGLLQLVLMVLIPVLLVRTLQNRGRRAAAPE